MSSKLPPNKKKADELPLIVRLLRTLDRIDPERIEALWRSPMQDGATFEELIIRHGLADEREIAQAYAGHYLVPLFDPPDDQPNPVDPRISTVLPQSFCRDHMVAPLADDGVTLDVALFQPDALSRVDEIQWLTERQVRPMFAPLSVIERLIHVLFEGGTGSDSLKSMNAAQVDELNDVDAPHEKARVESSESNTLDPSSDPDEQAVHFINSTVQRAIQSGASDIHLDSHGGNCRVRMRVDGSLVEVSPPPLALLAPVIRRLKIWSKIDPTRCHLPQDGTLSLRTGEQRVEMRVNTCPTVSGEKVVVRVLDRNDPSHDIHTLGLDDRQFRDLSEAIRGPHGLMLVTGPSGSGMTTTLYSCVNEINDVETNICTIEDPVEFQFAGMNQVQMESGSGLDFASVMKSVLRQDPDVIMVGEVADGETARICTHAALAGHRVFSTLHSNDALSSVLRLRDLGVDPYLLSSTLRLLVAQRLLRRLCADCRTPVELDEPTASRFGLTPGHQVYRPGGCSGCDGKGYRGRLAVLEVIRINPRLAAMIQRGDSVESLKQAARADGMKTSYESAMDKVSAGLTSLEEVMSCGRFDEVTAWIDPSSPSRTRPKG